MISVYSGKYSRAGIEAHQGLSKSYPRRYSTVSIQIVKSLKKLREGVVSDSLSALGVLKAATVVTEIKIKMVG